MSQVWLGLRFWSGGTSIDKLAILPAGEAVPTGEGPTPPDSCGNGVCQQGEDAASCSDCAALSCGDGEGARSQLRISPGSDRGRQIEVAVAVEIGACQVIIITHMGVVRSADDENFAAKLGGSAAARTVSDTMLSCIRHHVAVSDTMLRSTVVGGFDDRFGTDNGHDPCRRVGEHDPPEHAGDAVILGADPSRRRDETQGA